MQFGLFYEWPNPELRDWRVLFEEGVEQIQYSETLGFDYCLIAEHHFTNYGNSPRAPASGALHRSAHTTHRHWHRLRHPPNVAASPLG